MEGYYVKREPESNGPVGRLRLEVKNVPQFKALLEKAQKEARQLDKTLDELSRFNLEIDFSVAEGATLES